MCKHATFQAETDTQRIKSHRYDDIRHTIIWHWCMG